MTDLLNALLMAFSALAMALSLLVMSRQLVTNPLARPRAFRWKRAALVALIAIFSRALMLFLSMLVLRLIPDNTQTLAGAWTHWDAGHYEYLANNGYTADQSTDGWLFIVFFPLYPALAGVLGGSFVTMTLVSWLALAGAAVMIDLECSPREGSWPLLFLLVFPVQVFLGAPYTESLFLLTTGGCLAAIHRRKWAAAGALGMLAALTRNLGVLTALAFVVGYLESFREKVKKGGAQWKKLVPDIVTKGGLYCALIPLGTVIYLIINQAVYGDPFIFLQIQKDHWSQSFGLFYEQLSRSVSCAMSFEPIYRNYLFIPQAVLIVISLVGMPFLLKKMRPADAVYSVAYFVCILSPTWLLSFARYLMGMVTLYPALARCIKRPWLRWALAAVFLICSVPMAIAYWRGWPVM